MRLVRKAKGLLERQPGRRRGCSRPAGRLTLVSSKEHVMVRLRLSAALIAVLVLAACTDSDNLTSPTGILPGGTSGLPGGISGGDDDHPRRYHDYARRHHVEPGRHDGCRRSGDERHLDEPRQHHDRAGGSGRVPADGDRHRGHHGQQHGARLQDIRHGSLRRGHLQRERVLDRSGGQRRSAPKTRTASITAATGARGTTATASASRRRAASPDSG